jgi:general secretion pathway protein K
MKLVSAKQRGVAMVVVLWMVSLLAIMAASFSLSTQRNTSLVSNAQDRARGLALADAGVHYAMLMLSIPDPLKRWRSDGLPYDVQLPGGLVHLMIFDESGKIDVNAASEQTLKQLLSKVLGNDDMAAELADKIMDWRDVDSLKRLNGAEAKEYQAAGKPYVPSNKNFQALEELQMVLGMTPMLYKTLEPLLTIYTGQDGVNPQKATPEALTLLYGLDPKTVMDYVQQRRATPANMAPPPFMPPPGTVRAVAGGDVAYTVFASSKTEDGAAAGLKVVFRRQFSRSNGAPFAFVDWKQQIFGASTASSDKTER